MKRVAKDPKDLQRHVEGKKFKRALARGSLMRKLFFVITYLAEAAKEAEGEEDREVPSTAQGPPTSSQDSSEANAEDSGEGMFSTVVLVILLEHQRLDAVPSEEAGEDAKAGKKRKLPAKAAGKKKSRRA